MKFLILITVLLNLNFALAQNTTSSSLGTASSSASTSVSASSSISLQDFDVKNKYSFSFNSFASSSYRAALKNNANIDSINYISFNYKLNPEERFSIRPTFYANSYGYNNRNELVESKSSLADLQLVYSRKSYGEFLGMKSSGSLKLYLPTSEFSRRTEMIAKFRPETYFDYDLTTSDTLTYLLKPDFYLQSHNYFVDENTTKTKTGTYKYDPRKTTKKFVLEQSLGIYHNINRSFGVVPSFGFIDEWSNSQEDLGERHNTDFKSSILMDWRVIRQLTFTMGVENKVRITDRRDPLMFFHPNDNSFILMTNAYL